MKNIITSFLLIFFMMSAFSASLTSHFEECHNEKEAMKLFLLNVSKEVKKNPSLFQDPGLDGSIARSFGALTEVDKVGTGIEYAGCLTLLKEGINSSDKDIREEAFLGWLNCLPDKESLKKEIKKLRKCFDIE